MNRKEFVAGCLAVAATALGAGSAAAQDTIKIGIVAPMTGTSAAVGREISAGANLYMAQHGNMVAGKKIELIIRDDASVPDNAKRLAQEMIVNDNVNFLGACLTPSAMSMAPISAEGKVAHRGHGVGHVGGDRALALLRAHEFHARPAVRHHRRLGDQERQPESRLRAVRLGAGRRGRQGF